jgi:hypothetical protein
MLRKIRSFLMNLGKPLQHRGQCTECNCSTYDGTYPDNPYCRCGHHYDSHRY